MRVVWLLPSLFACIGPGTSLPPEDRATPERLLELPGYSEGVAFDAHGTAFFSVGRNPEDQHAVYQLRPGLQPTMWLSLRIPNGHKVLRDGTHVVAGDGVILHVAPDGGLLDSLTSDGFGRPLRRPNDIALDGNDGFFFTDPGRPGAGTSDGKVFYADRTFHIGLAADSFCYPNGLVVKPDGRMLYLDDSCNGHVYRIPITGPGQLGPRQVLATIPDSGDSGLDGITLDASGRLYVAHNGLGRIEVLDTLGHILRRYAAGQTLASNVAFGGRGLEDLFITGSPVPKSGPGGLYRLHLGIRGRSSMAVPAP